jgi:hypothetical protein
VDEYTKKMLTGQRMDHTLAASSLDDDNNDHDYDTDYHLYCHSQQQAQKCVTKEKRSQSLPLLASLM